MSATINTRMAAYQGLEEMTRYKDLKHLNPGKDAIDQIANSGDEYEGKCLASGIRDATNVKLAPGESSVRFAELAYNARQSTLQILANGMGGTLGATAYMIGRPLLDAVTQEFPSQRSAVLRGLGSASAGSYSQLVTYLYSAEKGVTYDSKAVADASYEVAFNTGAHLQPKDAAYYPTVYLRVHQKLRQEHPQEAAAASRTAIDRLLLREKESDNKNQDRIKALQAAIYEPGMVRRIFGAKKPSVEQVLELQEKAFIACGANISPVDAPS